MTMTETQTPATVTSARIVLDAVSFAALATIVPIANDGKGARPILGHVVLREREGQLQAVATDSYRLVMMTLKGTCEGLEGGFEMVIPSSLIKSASAAKMTGPAIITVFGESVTIERPTCGVLVTGRVLDGKFPAVDQLVPSPFVVNLTDVVAFNPEFLADISKVAPFNNKRDKTRSVKIVHLDGNQKPAVFAGDDDTVSTLYLLMPVRASR